MGMLPCGTFNTKYANDMAIVRTRLQWGLLIAFFILLFSMPFYASQSILHLIIIIAITAITVQGLNILTGYTGMLSLGQAAFMAVGGYTSAILCTKLGLSFWLALPCAGLSAGIVGSIFGLPAIRLKGFYLAMATLAAHFIIIYTIYVIPDLTGGAGGMRVPYPRLGNIEFNNKESFYFIAVGVAVIMTFFAKNLARTRVGRAFVAIRDSDIAANVLGINLSSYKLLAFFICSFYAGIAGSLSVHYFRFISAEQFLLMDSIWYLGIMVVGGAGTALGPILGSAFIKALEAGVAPLVPWLAASVPAVALAPGSIPLIIFAVTIIVFIIFEPRGLAHRWEIAKTSYRFWPFTYGR